MSKRDLLKGRVKRLLKEQKDMGQVAESAVLTCASAVQVLVRDLARKMQDQAASSANGLTPINLKKGVLACEELEFLHEKVEAIDESAAKYHKPARGKKRPLKADANKPTAKKQKAAVKNATTAATTAVKAKQTAKQRIKNNSATQPASAKALEVEEDDDYDESDSDSD